ncbi:hypothetical protein MBM_08751 [Drepanopeziza brunnea f. sp. 'multigermtubi' MB_m1]|uniref:Uncharacterized protein n=1 Tax=Marssonina brunnea f. sp. multigermtubi (strain MB_m1) TaxID=1072389 RepID=K1XKJ3_MARBU|nr:uncharacterized protein MBM_08751 [Drepanopeziza brunnea f. sp. 'multigermtubi' MB_m1]EKD12989.1 hypothetical protein MBM_08751 [Drepanopeziza brunnea f. sp. 'multigermtubi' MB_m1]
MRLSQSICSTLLASSFLFGNAQGKDDRRIIGYRTVSRAEADFINKNNKLYRDTDFDLMALLFNQFGPGFNIVNVPAGWPGAPDEWYCVIEADRKKFNSASKLWIPEDYQQVNWIKSVQVIPLWSGNEHDVKSYIRSKKLDPEKTLRFLPVTLLDPDRNELLQMIIPTEVVNSNQLDLWAECWETKRELYDYSRETVYYMSWNIVGKPK